ncbi:TPA: oligosaccharide flippase family protein [Klebsiella pneumoniae]|uniref:Putative O-antigen transporter n=1 Tax=Klebsiella pneumoniae TaxID=573 RepID=A0A1C3SZL5_KLEPN|nr:oligosaccharide flippase family protein [Klebsiella pneumoniae]EIX9156600.1 oligosaccharide flippase family protein [Klebsiella pneumoniae]EJS3663953.1 oligosaccharide flippase family protein [Klebsiella pneumoniae]EKW0825648.1 oligosaccharide flippase family protein [Klebsiella pneumoniae]EKX4216551.1 oligosaccharide flippase family protein [Klebsiella pneumoniae]ELA2935633.1 oligosaccharide flippase family protein [Klebsiella pneumoniae]
MKKLISNIIYLISEKFLTTFILLVSNIIVIRHLGVESFGKLAIFQVYFALAVTVSEFGIRRVYSSFRTYRREIITFSEVLLLKTILSGSFFMATLLVVYFFKLDVIYYLLALAFLASPFESYSYHFEANLNNQLLSKIRVSVSLFLALLRILLCFISADLILIILSFSISNIIINLLCYWQSKKKGFKPDYSLSAARKLIIRKHLLSRSLFFWLSVVVVQLNLRTDQFMLSIMTSAASVGIYAGAYKLVEQFMMIPSILAGVFLPHISRQTNIDRNLYLKRLYFYSLIISVPVSLGCAVVAPFLLPALLGQAFNPSVPVFQLLALSLPVLVLVNLSGLYYSIHKLEKYAVFRNLFGLFLSLSLNAVFIKLGGVVGAALSVLISYTLVAFFVEFLLPITRKNAMLKLESLRDCFLPQSYKSLIYEFKDILHKRKYKK